MCSYVVSSTDKILEIGSRIEVTQNCKGTQCYLTVHIKLLKLKIVMCVIHTEREEGKKKILVSTRRTK